MGLADDVPWPVIRGGKKVRGRAMAALSLGANLGDGRAALAEAAERIGAIAGVALLRSSCIHITAPLLVENQPKFFNRCLLIETSLGAEDLLSRLQAIELAMGRVREERYGPRPIDIDILLFEGPAIATHRLSVPHPQLLRRRFCIEELADFKIFLAAEDEAVMEQQLEKIEEGEFF
ncbi:MAG: 2-amino-4-hydroxy-6-hydroxymethyldihydropteridine diphosphokinase [Puniceicoccales bacterium]|nr:2-amino-4-hydroxy-6-hydroxymethyldihydropteridine diphosphokinase [Puniceicoccales bacterium]